MKNIRFPLQKKVFLIGVFFILFIPFKASSQQPDNGLKLLDAVKATISKQPAILIQEQGVDINKSILQQEEGIFDPKIGANVSREDDNTPLLEANRAITGLKKSEQILTTYQVSINKRLRTGILLSPNIQMNRTDDLSFGAKTSSEASVNFTVTFPLLRGKGRESTEADVMAATSGLEASELDLRHIISQSILNTGDAYWNFLATKENLSILKETETRAHQLVKDVEELVAADERPSSDLDQLHANLATKTDDRIRGEQALYEAQQSLGIAMGLPFNEIDGLPPPVDPFPQTIPEEALFTDYDQKGFIDLSREHRADLMALRKREESAKILLKSAEINKKPQLDFSVNLGYKGLDEGESEKNYYDSFYHKPGGLNFFAGLSYQYPLGNNAAIGLFYQRRSAYNQALIQTADQDRNIRSAVAVAMQALIRSLKELEEARKSVSYYQKAVENEELKLKLGMSTVIDVVTIEDRLRNALLREVSARKNYSTALVELRFATGTLLSIREDEYTVTMEHLTSVPSINANP